MNWISEWALPKIQTWLGRREVPDNLWHKCPACEQMIFHRDLERSLHVCTHCGHHMRIPAQRRLDYTFDPGFQRIELPRAPADPLRFRDQRRYADRLKEAQAKGGQDDAVAVAHGTIEGRRAVVAAFEFSFMGGSMGAGVGEAIVTAAKLAVLQDAPLIVFTASGGARMQEGAVSLMQMPRTVIATQMVKEAKLPFIVVMCDPTTGGVTASFAMLGDIHIAEPGAMIGFAGARVIEQTVREKLPEGFQRAEYLLEHGILDMVVKRGAMRESLARVISLLREPFLAKAGEAPAEAELAEPVAVIPAAPVPAASAPAAGAKVTPLPTAAKPAIVPAPAATPPAAAKPAPGTPSAS
ncbi:acetyl-CoA carboxylase, carboxyltransferase subunit beta [Roseomonas sp. 18066]|uniref:acetyl-CoA carboxylase, carboxyltransferase subunit beta n=1 Tax=Roseomonas sp. 18066 TaxID=2681412 RepID=UPI00135B6763|nr:acetyl-CoA carboxylase, carboxyltransferase subunit beta [Roseomonas sp. 18066]